MSLYNANGQINLTAVDGSTRTGLQAADGSWYIVLNDGTSWVGRYHPCGAFNAVLANGSTYGQAPNGSLYVNANSYGGYSPNTPLGNVGGSVIGPKPGTPVLTWTSDATDLTPDGTVVFDNIPLTGDIITSQIQVAGGNWSSPVLNNSYTITAADDLVNQASLSNSALSNGSYDWRVRITHNSSPSDWSNTETKTLSAFTPASLTPNLWVEARNGVYQTIDGTTTPASANNDFVGYLPDLSGNARHLTAAANDTTRPTLQGVGILPYLSFDGTNDVLFRTTALNLYASASGFTVAIALRSNSNAASARLIGEGRSTDANPIMCPLQAQTVTASSSGAFYRGDGGGNIGTGSPSTGNTPSNANVFNGADHVYVFTDDGTSLSSTSNITTYLDGVIGGTNPVFTRNGTAITVDRFALGALIRTSAAAWWAGRVYAMVIVPRVLTNTERANLTTYLGARAGLTL